MALNEVENLQGALDIPDPNDFSADHIFGAPIMVDLPEKVMLDCVPSHNQGKSWHCTAYGICHIHEIQNSREFGKTITMDPEEQWANQCEVRGVPLGITGGDSLQNALKTLLKYGLKNTKNPDINIPVWRMTGYAFVDKNLDNFRAYLAQGFPIYTGWKEHCFCLVGYDNNKNIFIAKNSYGPTDGLNHNGTFDIAYSDIAKLFSGYIGYDKKDIPMIFRDVSTNSPNADAIKFALDKNLMMGYGSEPLATDRLFRPDQPMTRAEFAVVLKRLYEQLK